MLRFRNISNKIDNQVPSKIFDYFSMGKAVLNLQKIENCPAREYFDSHPEWFAWSDVEGKRINYGHYCLSSEGFYQAVLEKLIDYIKHNKVDLCCCTEVSRVGRDTLEALKTIEILNENHVNLYFANYGIETLLPDGSVNPIARLILTICLEISAYERNLIRYRMKAGYEDYLKRRKSNPELRLGRQGYKKDEQSYRQDYAQELSLLRKGISMRNVQKLTGTSLGTLQKIKQYL